MPHSLPVPLQGLVFVNKQVCLLQTIGREEGGADRENEGSHTNKKLLSYKVLSIYLL